MTWEELVEKAKKLGYECGEMMYNDEPHKYLFYYGNKHYSLAKFLDNGDIVTDVACRLVVTNRSYDQMYQIMLALED
jgi:hypothetical protein